MSSFEAKLICISPLRHTFESISHWQTLEPRETTPVGFAVVVGDNVEGDDVGDSAVDVVVVDEVDTVVLEESSPVAAFVSPDMLEESSPVTPFNVSDTISNSSTN